MGKLGIDLLPLGIEILRRRRHRLFRHPFQIKLNLAHGVMSLRVARAGYSPPPREWTYTASALMVASSRRSPQAGMCELRALKTVA